jgi:hypothetical protein
MKKNDWEKKNIPLAQEMSASLGPRCRHLPLPSCRQDIPMAQEMSASLGPCRSLCRPVVIAVISLNKYLEMLLVKEKQSEKKKYLRPKRRRRQRCLLGVMTWWCRHLRSSLFWSRVVVVDVDGGGSEGFIVVKKNPLKGPVFVVVTHLMPWVSIQNLKIIKKVS